MNQFEYAVFLAEKDKHSREHQQLIRDSKVGILDLDKYKSDKPKRLVFENEESKQNAIDTLTWDELRCMVDKS